MEKRLFPLWLVNYAVTNIKGEEAPMSYETFLMSIFNETESDSEVHEKERTAQDIMDELMPFVEADQKKGG